MSASFYTHLVYGALICSNDLCITIPNPLYGKYKFDPNTGKQVDEFISGMIDIHKIAHKYNLDVSRTTDSVYYVIGKDYGSSIIGESDSEFVEMGTEPTDELRKLIACAIDEMGLEPINPNIYALGYCSY